LPSKAKSMSECSSASPLALEPNRMAFSTLGSRIRTEINLVFTLSGTINMIENHLIQRLMEAVQCRIVLFADGLIDRFRRSLFIGVSRQIAIFYHGFPSFRIRDPTR